VLISGIVNDLTHRLESKSAGCESVWAIGLIHLPYLYMVSQHVTRTVCTEGCVGETVWAEGCVGETVWTEGCVIANGLIHNKLSLEGKSAPVRAPRDVGCEKTDRVVVWQ
jgi:hypothetical protein